jgi:hypothetical protein
LEVLEVLFWEERLSFGRRPAVFSETGPFGKVGLEVGQFYNLQRVTCDEVFSYSLDFATDFQIRQLPTTQGLQEEIQIKILMIIDTPIII